MFSIGLCCKKFQEDKMSREQLCLLGLSHHSEHLGDQGYLASHIAFVHPLQLPFSHRVHDLVPRYRFATRRDSEKKPIPGFVKRLMNR